MVAGPMEVKCCLRKMWYIRNACPNFTPHKCLPHHHTGLTVGDLMLALGETGMVIVITLGTVDAGKGIDGG